MVDLRNRTYRMTRSSRTLIGAWLLPLTADGFLGMSNLATVPRAGNISSDSRAGRIARSG
jgi:hypothetical protein